MSIRCKNCGGVVTQPVAGPVNCEYCGALIQPESAPEPKSAAPAPGVPRAAAVQKQGSRASIYVVIVLLSLVVIGVAYFVQSGGALSTFGEWYSHNGVNLIDANGDEVLDIVGWAGSPTDQRNLSIIDGLTGQRLWVRSQGYESEALVLSISERYFAVTRPNFSLELFEVGNRDQPVVVRLGDRISEYSVGQDCLHIVTADDASVGLRLPSGERVACASVESPLRPHQRPETSEEAAATAKLGDITYQVTRREQGTPMLTVSAHRGPQVLWSVPLRYAAVSREIMILATPDMILTYGVEPGRENVGVLVGLDPSTGAVQYEHSQGSEWSARQFFGFRHNGRYLIIPWGFGLHAYEPATGERVWHLGGR